MPTQFSVDKVSEFWNSQCRLPFTTHIHVSTLTDIERAFHANPVRSIVISALSVQVLIVTTEFVGPVSNGGIGTAYTTLAHTLKAAGHMVR